MMGNNNGDRFTRQVWLPLVLSRPPGLDKAGGLGFGAVLRLEQFKRDCAAFFYNFVTFERRLQIDFWTLHVYMRMFQIFDLIEWQRKEFVKSLMLRIAKMKK